MELHEHLACLEEQKSAGLHRNENEEGAYVMGSQESGGGVHRKGIAVVSLLRVLHSRFGSLHARTELQSPARQRVDRP